MIEINRNSEWTYRLNPWNPLIIDRRANRHAARWLFYACRATAEDALTYLLELEKGESVGKNG